MAEAIGTRDFFYYIVPGSMITVGLILLCDVFFIEFEITQFLSLQLTEVSFWIYVLLFGSASYFIGHVVIWPLGRMPLFKADRRGRITREVLQSRTYLIEPLCAYWNIDKRQLLKEDNWKVLQRIYRLTYRLVMQFGSQGTIEFLRRNAWIRRFHREMLIATTFFGSFVFVWGLASRSFFLFLGIPIIFPICTYVFRWRQRNSDMLRKRVILDQFFVLRATGHLRGIQDKNMIKQQSNIRNQESCMTLNRKALAEIEQLYEQWRHRDRLGWASAPVAITVSGVLVGIAYGYIPDSNPIVRSLILVLAIMWTFSMFIMITKNLELMRGTVEKLKGRDFDAPLFHYRKDRAMAKFAEKITVFELMLFLHIFLVLALCYMVAVTLIL